MFKGYSVKLDLENDSFYNEGLKMYQRIQSQIELSIKSLQKMNGVVDGSKMQANWFPQIEADIFISHSHKDQDLAITLAGWLKIAFNLNTFIDSCVWGYSKDLQLLLDNEYSWLDKEKRIYDYEKVLYSASHVNMMLSTALTMMIDRTECIFFLNTDNSIKSFRANNKTTSPWLYSELAITKLVRKKELKEHRVDTYKSFSEGGTLSGDLKMNYTIDTSHLLDISLAELNKWYHEYSIKKPHFPLDVLYRMSSNNQTLNG